MMEKPDNECSRICVELGFQPGEWQARQNPDGRFKIDWAMRFGVECRYAVGEER